MKRLFVRMIYAGEHESVYVTLFCERVVDLCISFITKMYTKHHSIKMPSFKINVGMKWLLMKMIYAGEHDTIYVTLCCMRLWHHRGDVCISFITKIHTKYHSINPYNAKATFVQSTWMQRFLKTIQTLSFWYSLDSPH